MKVPYFLVAALAPLMAPLGQGTIVNVSSMVADYEVAGRSVYGSSKAALNLLTKAWAAEYGPSGERINTVSPGPTRMGGTAGPDDARDRMAAKTQAGRRRRKRLRFPGDRTGECHLRDRLAVDGGRTAI